MRILIWIMLSIMLLTSLFIPLSLRYTSTSIVGGGEIINIGFGNFTRSYVGYMLLGVGDRVSFDVTSDHIPWTYILSIVKVDDGETYNYSMTFFASRAPTPVFIAPEPGLYFYNLTIIINAPEEKHYNINVKIAGTQCARYNIITSVSTAIVILLILIILVYYSSRHSMPNYIGFIGLIKWEIKCMWKWIFIIAVMYIYSFSVIDFSSLIGSSRYVLLNPISFSRCPNFFVLYLVLIASLASITYSYEWEIRLTRTIDMLPMPRWIIFIVKLISIWILVYLPLFLMSLLAYILWMPLFILKAPLLFLEIFCSEMFFYFILLSFILIFVLPPVILIPRTAISILASIAPCLMIFLDLIPFLRSFNLRLFILNLEPMNALNSLSPIAYNPLLTNYEEHLEQSLSVKISIIYTNSLILILILIVMILTLLFIYCRRENP